MLRRMMFSLVVGMLNGGISLPTQIPLLTMFPRTSAIPNGSKLLSFTLIIQAIPPTWLALPPTWLVLQLCIYVFSYLHYFQVIILLYNCASASNAVFLPPLWYQSHYFPAGDGGVVFSISPSVSTRNFGTLLLCSLLIIIGATLVVK